MRFKFLATGRLIFCALFTSASSPAQVFEVLHTFTNSPDGAVPAGGLGYDGKFLYGATRGGGSYSNGTLFRIRPGGQDYNVIFNLSTNYGKGPVGSPTVNGSDVYFGTSSGGTYNNGTIACVNNAGTTNGWSSFGAVRSFSNNDGYGCNGGFTFNGGVLFGTMRGRPVPIAPAGGDNLFGIQPDGSGFAIVTNLFGMNPNGGLASAGTFLYGTTQHGGAGWGSVYRLNLANTNYEILKAFTSGDGTPNGYLLLVGSNLFGTTWWGGAAGGGTVFKLSTNGGDFSVLKNFSNATGNKSDGTYPAGGLVISGDTLFGVTSAGGALGAGTVFRINTDGSGFAVLKSFGMGPLPAPLIPNSDGASPNGPLVLGDGKLYGTATNGGSAGVGVIFRITLPPEITINDTDFGIASNRFQFNVTGISNLNVDIERSSNLVGWTKVQSRTLDGRPFLFKDLYNDTNVSPRFYRLRVR